MSIEAPQASNPAPVSYGGAPLSGGFVAGTLIHTKRGLLPLGQLQVGDEIALASEPGLPLFSPIVKLMRKPDQSVVLLEFIQHDELSAGELIVHPDQLFWVAEQGWTAAHRLSYGMPIKRLGKADATALRVLDLFATEQAQVACNFDQSDFTGPTIDLRDQAIRIFYEGVPNDTVTSGEIEPFSCELICLQVASADHMLVGNMGILVRLDPVP
ncbi:hypothetical protein [Undibacterium parvum]|uniref:Hedgehog/Intein (Hint) domain-containing protein n=2 Tax=Undibacterium TaxID=401469 RepID=A0A6M4A4Y7_9BURK|nr:hypothetical protein [Undibacterium parvum]AZP14173.1 hypothetical protein EJN92_20525 [Undibacterium parvum]QJQ05099.1 hypothetical protein EJG51_003625 [Undibacterium piscinae]